MIFVRLPLLSLSSVRVRSLSGRAILNALLPLLLSFLLCSLMMSAHAAIASSVLRISSASPAEESLPASSQVSTSLCLRSQSIFLWVLTINLLSTVPPVNCSIMCLTQVDLCSLPSPGLSLWALMWKRSTIGPILTAFAVCSTARNPL